MFNPFAFTSDLPAKLVGAKEGEFEDDPRLNHKGREILIGGIGEVESTYDSPTILFKLLRLYCQLNNISIFNGLFYRKVNNSFIKPLGSEK